MPLVDYSSDSSNEANGITRKKQKVTQTQRQAQELPPLPAAFRDLYATAVRTSNVDDPSMHGGRHRVTPHVEGNWPTHVYAEWIPSLAERDVIFRLSGLCCKGEADIHDFLTSDLGAPAPLHISLSRSLGLGTDQKEAFSERLQSSVKNTAIATFKTRAAAIRWVPNFTKTRWFLVLQLGRPDADQLNRLLAASNETAAAFGFPGLYTGHSTSTADSEAPPGPGEVDDSLNLATQGQEQTKHDPFHVSIAWSLSKPKSTTAFLDDRAPEISKYLQQLQIPVDSVKAKIGNSILTIPLKANKEVEIT